MYAWRCGPRLKQPIGTPEFFRELADVTAAHTAPDHKKLLSLVAEYRASDDWKGLAEKTRKNWIPFLNSISENFGTTSIAAFDRPLIRVVIRKWRDQYKHSPRQADMALQVLSRILSFGVAQGRLQANACKGIPRLYTTNRAQLIWTDEHIAAIANFASDEVMWLSVLVPLQDCVNLTCYACHGRMFSNTRLSHAQAKAATKRRPSSLFIVS